jgi:fucose 4-O-acetylase-like acetyltransferase
MPKSTENRNFALDYLRAFVVLLVVAHHTALAYTTFIPGPAPSFTAQLAYWTAFPILDPRRWAGFNVLVAWNDIFFMSLMFFLSGLFVSQGFSRKGAIGYLKHRAVRLGVPFVFLAGVISPLAYYPTYRLTGADPSLFAYAKAWLALGFWPSGPAWFLWVLLSFDCIAVACFALAPTGMQKLSALWRKAGERPMVFYAALVALSACVYVPLAHLFGGDRWSSFGPFAFQTSRGLHYCLYFFVGAFVGASGIGEGLLASGGRLARRWWIWSVVSVLAFVGATAAVLAHKFIAANLGFVIACAAISFALLADFLRFAKKSSVWDSLSSNSFGIYITHYAFVVWLQYAFLSVALPAVAKASCVFAGAVALSWAVTAAYRQLSTPQRSKGEMKPLPATQNATLR